MLVLAVAFATGVCWDRFATAAEYPSGVLVWWMAAACWLAAWWGLGRWFRGRPTVGVRSVVLCGGVLCAGAAWHHARWNHFDVREIGRYAAPHAAPTCVEAVALQSPRSLPAIPPSPYRAIPVGERSQVPLAVTGIRRGTTWQPARGHSRLTVDGQLLGVQAGDRVRIFALISAPRKPQNPGEFDYALHARAERRLAEFRTGFPECVEVVQRGAWHAPRRLLNRVQTWCLNQFQRLLGRENGAVAAALVVGAQEGIAHEEYEAFRTTGTIHLLVISGLHVGIVATVALFVSNLLFTTRRRVLVATACIVVAFAVFTGGKPPVIRATVCTLAVMAALGTGSPTGRLNILSAAALTVLILNPSDLFRPGPQLSFLAAGTLIGYAAWVRQRREAESELDQLKREARPVPLHLLASTARWAGHLFAVAFCVWLVTLPLIMCYFHLFSPIAVIASPLVGLVAWHALTSSIALLQVHALIPFASGIVALVCGGLIALLRKSVAFAASIPFGHFWVSGPSVWWTVGFYAVLAGLLLLGRRVPLRWKVAAFALWVAVGFLASLLPPRETGELRCTFLSVGHGTCVVLRTPDGKCLLYDAGSLGSPELAAESIAACLWAEGISRLDGVILSHADIDHFNAMPGLIQRFSMSGAFVSTVMFDPLVHPDPSGAPRQLQDALAASNIPVREVFASDRLNLGGGVTARVLHPRRQPVLGATDNAYSIVLVVEYAGRRVLLTGDLESPGMDDVLAERPLDVDVLLAPHHGSRFSDPPGLARWCSPEWVVISGGDEAGSAEAAQTYREAGGEVAHTSTVGALDFRISREGVTLRHWAGDAWEPFPRRDLP
jgi:competence protein ComEC